MTANFKSRFLVLVLLVSTLACSIGPSGDKTTEVTIVDTPPAYNTPTATPTPPPPRPDVGYTPVPDPQAAPRILYSAPAGGQELPLDQELELVFDRPMNRASVEKSFQVLPALAGKFEWSDDQTVRFRPENDLARGQTYDVVVDQTAVGQNGDPLLEPFQLRFSTIGYLEVGQVTPADGADDVNPVGTSITVMFNRPVVPLTLLAGQAQLPQPITFSPAIPGRGEWVNTSIYLFTPDGPLAGGTTYRAIVNKGLEDTTGGVLADDYNWSFRTAPPKVIQTTPQDGDSLIRVQPQIRIEFNMPIDHQSAQEAFSLNQERQVVSGKFDIDGSVLVFTPTNRLNFDSTYHVKLAAGIRAGAGGDVGMVNDYSFSFQTVPLPAIVDTDPKHRQKDAYPYTGFTIFFNAPINPATVLPHVDLGKNVTATAVFTNYNQWNNSFTIQFGAQPSTDYSFTISPGIEDEYGNKIERGKTVTFRTAPLEPDFRLHVPEYVATYDSGQPTRVIVAYVNLTQIDFRLFELPATALTHPYWDWEDNPPPSSALLRQWQETVEAPLNERGYAAVQLVEGGGSLSPGVYLLEATSRQLKDRSARRTAQRHILVVSPLNLTLKNGARDGLVWATRLDDGNPVSGLEIELYDVSAEQTLGSAITDKDGIAKFSLSQSSPGRLIALADEPFAAVSTDWSRGTSSWDFGLPSAYDWQNIRTYIYSDRPIYRPGQTVNLKGIVRLEDDASYQTPDGGYIDFAIRDTLGNMVAEETLTLDEMGTFNTKLELKPDAPLGMYYVSATFQGRTGSSTFVVAAYRPPEFQVEVTSTTTETSRGEPIDATVNASYFFGGAVAGIPVDWNVLVDRYVFKPPWGGDYTFTFNDDSWYCFDCWWREPEPPTPIASGSGQTDDQGQLLIALAGDLLDTAEVPFQGSAKLTIEATGYGQDNQAISGRQSLIVHQGDFYVGLKARRYIGEAGKPFETDLVTVDWEGRRLANKAVTVSVFRREWENRFTANESGGGRWETEKKDTLIDTLPAVTNTQGESVASFTPPSAGSYVVIAEATDGEGRRIKSNIFAWVSGTESVSWRRENNDRINLVADKSTYAPGETASILIPSPYDGPHYALLTVERGRILSQQVVLLQSNSTVYELPIGEGDVPNIYVSAILLKGREADGKPADYKMGLLPLDVASGSKTLNIAVETGESKVEPGSVLDYQITVTDDAGQPVQTELSVDVVDKAVLSLQPRPENAIKEAFYSRRGLGIETANGLAVSANRLMEDVEEELGLDEKAVYREADAGAGTMATMLPAAAPAPAEEMALEAENGAAPPPGVTLREEFADTAFWAPVVLTDEAGRASLTLTLPDNLTTWVLRGVGVDPQTQVGEGTAEVIATKPLLIRPITPRFLVREDRVVFGAAVSNNTDGPLQVAVSLSSTGIKLEDRKTQPVSIKAGQETTVRWSAVVSDVSQVDLVFSAVSEQGGYSDASKPRLSTGPDGSLAVYSYTAPDIVGTAGDLDQAGSKTEILALPPGYQDLTGELALNLAPSLAAGIRDGLTYLKNYPYNCSEQIASRLLPNALNYRALTSLGVQNEELLADLTAVITEAQQALYVRQNDDGGWGWWPGDDSSEYVSGYVVFALLKTQQAGFEVRQDILDRGVNYLAAKLLPASDLKSRYAVNRQAWFLFVLSEAGQAPGSALDELYQTRDLLSLYARAFLAMAMFSQAGDSDQINTLLSDLNNSLILSATGAHWEEADRDWWAMGTDTRSTAIILETLIRLQPDNAIIPNVVRWLMVAREGDAWSTTQETAWSLMALTDWMLVTGELAGKYDYNVSLDDKPVIEGQVTSQNVGDSEKLSLDVQEWLQAEMNRLVISRTDGPGRLYYTAHLKVFLPVEDQPAVDRGITIQRRYSLADCQEGIRCPDVKEVKEGDVIRVDLTIIVPNDLYYVVVEDMLPAGAEAVDTGLATTSLLAASPQLSRVRPEENGGYVPWYWDWWNWYSRSELRDEKVVLFADVLSKGTYEYSYTMRATTPGDFHVIPSLAYEFYFPEVFGRSEGRLLSIGQTKAVASK